MMYDIKKGGIEVFVHDVRMQLVDVFRWVCPRVGSSEKGHIQGPNGDPAQMVNGPSGTTPTHPTLPHEQKSRSRPPPSSSTYHM